ncbi:MAG: RnfABCDGE type electron transport complex subunit G [Thermotogota bacterium]
MKDYLKTGSILMLYMIVAAFLVAVIYNFVNPFIQTAEFNAKLDAIKSVLIDFETEEYYIQEIPETSEELEEYIWEKSEENIMMTNSENSKIMSPAYKFSTEEKEIYVLTIAGLGFGGDVTSVASFVKENGNIRLNKIEVISYSQETPGLGAKIAEEEVQSRFYNIPEQGLNSKVQVNKDAGASSDPNVRDDLKEEGTVQTSDVMTGATITPRGVANSLNIAVEFLSEKGVM